MTRFKSQEGIGPVLSERRGVSAAVAAWLKALPSGLAMLPSREGRGVGPEGPFQKERAEAVRIDAPPEATSSDGAALSGQEARVGSLGAGLPRLAPVLRDAGGDPGACRPRPRRAYRSVLVAGTRDLHGGELAKVLNGPGRSTPTSLHRLSYSVCEPQSVRES